MFDPINTIPNSPSEGEQVLFVFLYVFNGSQIYVMPVMLLRDYSLNLTVQEEMIFIFIFSWPYYFYDIYIVRH